MEQWSCSEKLKLYEMYTQSSHFNENFSDIWEDVLQFRILRSLNKQDGNVACPGGTGDGDQIRLFIQKSS